MAESGEVVKQQERENKVRAFLEKRGLQSENPQGEEPAPPSFGKEPGRTFSQRQESQSDTSSTAGQEPHSRFRAAPEDHATSTIAERIARLHPDWPKMKVKFFFSPHVTAEDMAGMKEHMEDADIYLYESERGDRTETTKFLQQLANLDQSDLSIPISRIVESNKLQGTAGESMARSVYGSKKIIGTIDTRPGDPLEREDLARLLSHNYLADDFDQTLNGKKEFLKSQVQFQEKREKIMTARFEEELARILAEHPELKDKPELKILATMGSYHTPLFHKFRAEGIDTERVFSQTPYVYPYNWEIQRDFAFGKEPSRDILAKAYLETMFSSPLREAMGGRPMKTDQAGVYLRQIVSRFSTSEIEAIHKMSLDTMFSLPVDKINDLLRIKGLEPLPRSNEELERWVKEREEAERAKKAEVKAEF